jgi:DNA-binding transcriptional regulator YiaG
MPQRGCGECSVQPAFTSRIRPTDRVPVSTVRDWERGKLFPEGPAGVLLRVIDEVPEAALALRSG